MKQNLRTVAFGVLTAAALYGCGGSEGAGAAPPVAAGAAPVAAAPPAPTVSIASLGIGNLPGMPGTVVTDPVKVFEIEERMVASRYGRARSDPFSLKSKERSYEIQQDSARLLGEMGSWVMMYTPAPEKAPDAGLIQDPQPYRRLSGIIVGDSVYALLDTGGQIEIIRPGMRVPNTEWTVVSIDEEKAILRRTGNKVPRQITVRLESPPAGMGGASGPAGGPAAPGAPAGGGGGRPGQNMSPGGGGPGTGFGPG